MAVVVIVTSCVSPLDSIILIHCPTVRSPNEAKTVRSEGGCLYIFKKREGLSINITRMLPHEAALKILSYIRDVIDRRNEELLNEETTPLEASEPAWG